MNARDTTFDAFLERIREDIEEAGYGFVRHQVDVGAFWILAADRDTPKARRSIAGRYGDILVRYSGVVAAGDPGDMDPDLGGHLNEYVTRLQVAGYAARRVKRWHQRFAARQVSDEVASWGVRFGALPRAAQERIAQAVDGAENISTLTVSDLWRIAQGHRVQDLREMIANEETGQLAAVEDERAAEEGS